MSKQRTAGDSKFNTTSLDQEETFLLTAAEVEMKPADSFQSDDIVLNNIFGKRFGNTERSRIHVCVLAIPLLRIIPVEIQQQPDTIYRKMLTAVLSIKGPNWKHINGQH